MNSVGISNRAAAVRMTLDGKSQGEIAQALNVSRQRVGQMLAQARRSGDFKVQVRILNAEGIALDEVAPYLRRALASAGIQTGA